MTQQINLPGAPARRILRRPKSKKSWIVTVVIGVLVLAPLLALLYGALSNEMPILPGAHLTLDNVIYVVQGLAGGPLLLNLLNSVVLALCATAVAMVIGVGSAWLFLRTNLPGRNILYRLFLVPMFYSIVLNIVGWIMIGEQNSGFVNQIWRALTGSTNALVNIYSFGGMVWVMGLFFAPYAMMLSSSSLDRTDSALDEAASVSGAGPLRRLFRIGLPMARPGILAAALFIFVLSIEQFQVPSLLGSHINYVTLSNKIYNFQIGFPNDPSKGAAVAILLVIITTIGLAFYRRSLRNADRFVTVSGKGQRAKQVDLGAWRWVLFVLAILLFAVIVVLPLAAVVLRALMSARTTSILTAQFSWENFVAAAQQSTFQQGIVDSLLLAGGSAVICVVAGVALAYWSLKRKDKAAAVADYLVSLPLGVPGIAFGLGVLWAFVATPIYLSVWVLLIAYVLRHAVYGVRTMTASLVQLDPSLVEAATTSGASRLRVALQITAPLLKGAMASSGILVFLLVFQELGSTIMLYGPNSSTMSVQIFSEINSGFFGPACALAVVQIAIIGVVVAVVSIVFRAKLTNGTRI